jgi:hypothetical protein
VRGRPSRTRHQWLLIVVIAAGLVGMHHLLLACTAQTMPIALATGSVSSLMMVPSAGATPILHAAPAPAGTNSVEASSVVTSQADCCDPMDMVEHFCLAVLTALTTFAAALIVAVAQRRPAEPGDLLVDVRVGAARAPPVGCAGLIQLCVLRS